MNNEVHVNHNKIFYVLSEKLWVIIIVTLICAGVGFFYGKMIDSRPPADNAVYKSQAQIMVNGNMEGASKNYRTELLSADIVLSDSVLQSVIDECELNLSKEELRKVVYAKQPSGQAIITIVTLYEDEDKVQKITNSLVKYGVREIQRLQKPYDISVVATASRPERVTVTLKGDTIIQSNNLTGLDTLVISPAAEAVQKSHESIKLGIVGGVIGLLIIIVLLGIYAIWKGGIRYPQELKGFKGIRFLGVYPYKCNNSMYIERIRQEISSFSQDMNSLMIVSCFPKEGKTTIAKALKQSFEKIGKSTVFIEKPDNGENKMQIKENDGDLKIIESYSLSERFDACIMADSCDGILLIIETGKVTSKVLKQAIAELKRREGRPIGVVINKTKFKIFDKNKEYFGMYFQ
ncbi:hypothetical protein [Zhenpiania hominis]|uniref:hypothetical protein n=1 Tax=Zhenpiania hominis TaxID=2763644 RepID=UPI0039F5A1B7